MTMKTRLTPAIYSVPVTTLKLHYVKARSGTVGSQWLKWCPALKTWSQSNTGWRNIRYQVTQKTKLQAQKKSTHHVAEGGGATVLNYSFITGRGLLGGEAQMMTECLRRFLPLPPRSPAPALHPEHMTRSVRRHGAPPRTLGSAHIESSSSTCIMDEMNNERLTIYVAGAWTKWEQDLYPASDVAVRSDMMFVMSTRWPTNTRSKNWIITRLSVVWCFSPQWRQPAVTGSCVRPGLATVDTYGPRVSNRADCLKPEFPWARPANHRPRLAL